MGAIIEVDRLTKVYNGGVTAVKGVSFQVEEGEIFGFLGPNGAGKSTTIMMLTTLLWPTSGRASVAGFDIVREPDQVRLSLGYVSQDLAVDDNLTGRENLYLQAGFYHLPRKEAVRRCEELLELVDLCERADDPVETYSGGMRKRLDIAAGLIHRPKVLFLDEPTLGLDIQTRHQIWQYINHLREEMNMTVFLTTHYMDEADALCNQIAIIDRGAIKVIDVPDNLKSQIGGDIVHIWFKKMAQEKFSEVIRVISSLPVVNSVKPHDGECIAVVENGDVAIPEIFRVIHPLEVEISSVTLKRPSLDDVYLAFTGRELRDETGSKEDAFRSRVMMRRMRTG